MDCSNYNVRLIVSKIHNFIVLLSSMTVPLRLLQIFYFWYDYRVNQRPQNVLYTLPVIEIVFTHHTKHFMNFDACGHCSVVVSSILVVVIVKHICYSTFLTFHKNTTENIFTALLARMGYTIILSSMRVLLSLSFFFIGSATLRRGGPTYINC